MPLERKSGLEHERLDTKTNCTRNRTHCIRRVHVFGIAAGWSVARGRADPAAAGLRRIPDHEILSDLARPDRAGTRAGLHLLAGQPANDDTVRVPGGARSGTVDDLDCARGRLPPLEPGLELEVARHSHAGREDLEVRDPRNLHVGIAHAINSP